MIPLNRIPGPDSLYYFPFWSSLSPILSLGESTCLRKEGSNERIAWYEENERKSKKHVAVCCEYLGVKQLER